LESPGKAPHLTPRGASDMIRRAMLSLREDAKG